MKIDVPRGLFNWNFGVIYGTIDESSALEVSGGIDLALAIAIFQKKITGYYSGGILD